MEPRTTWGRWVYHPDTFVLRFAEGTTDEYEVDLDRCKTSAEVLDWIFQVSKKGWVTAAEVGELVGALEYLLDPQCNLCSLGQDKPIDPRATVARVLKERVADEAKLEDMRRKGRLLGPREH